MNSNGVNGAAHHDAAPPDSPDDHDLHGELNDYWDQCHLLTILTDPPRHELTLPGGQVLRLRTPQFFDSSRFTMAFIDAVGSFPPLPKKKPGAFLQDKFRLWLQDREIRDVADEAGDYGTLLGDIRLALATCPESDDAKDIDRSAIFTNPEGISMVSGRLLMERVRRGCPVKVIPADFYAAFAELGAKNLGVRREEGWRGRVWQIPPSLRPEKLMLAEPAESAANGTQPEPAQKQDPGLFDDLLATPGTSEPRP